MHIFVERRIIRSTDSAGFRCTNICIEILHLILQKVNHFHLLLQPLSFEIERLSDDTMNREISQYQMYKKEKKKTELAKVSRCRSQIERRVYDVELLNLLFLFNEKSNLKVSDLVSCAVEATAPSNALAKQAYKIKQ